MNASFETFPQAVLTLFQIVCGEVWLLIMHECSVGLPFCTEAYGDELSDCGQPLLGPLFFFSFFILTFAVFLNLCVAQPPRGLSLRVFPCGGAACCWC